MIAMLMDQEPFVSAEVDYRRALATKQFSRGGRPRIHLPRRPTLHLPHPRRRPLSLA